ncbi:MAG: hypothetical protein IT581_10140 [Verrucomicrobiales bacterium]|nr:hypothetical protein [Verrucomicrobiales bacterium]
MILLFIRNKQELRRSGVLGIARPWLRRALSCLAAWLALGISLPTNATAPTSPSKIYLQVNFTVHGKGAAPEFEGDEQEWSFERSFIGYMEVEVTPTIVGEPPNDRSVLEIRPKSGGLTTVVGHYSGRSRLEFTTRGEGSSSMEYFSWEHWTQDRVMQPKDLILGLFLDEQSLRWDGQISIAGWDSVLSSQLKFEGFGLYVPGPAGGWEPKWKFHSTDPNERDSGGHSIGGGWFPPAPPIVDYPIATTAKIQGGFYHGSVDVPIPDPVPPANAGPGRLWRMDASLEWTLLDKLPEVDLIVRSSQYTQWIPSLLADNTPAVPLHFVASVESPTGDSLQRIRVKKYTWSLNGTSREPGLALNYPVDAKDSDPDLRLVGWTTDAEAQKSEHSPIDGDLTSSIEVHAHDWGAWSTLRLDAELEDGRVIHGRLVPPPMGGPDTDILIPRRRPESKVSDLWADLTGAGGKEDTADDEEKPAGRPGANGDGFSIYEEYRGFYVNGVHEWLDPLKKEVFVQNQVEGQADTALKKFKSLSGLTLLPVKENLIYFINYNRKEGPTAGQQAGIWIRPTSQMIRPNEGIPPKNRLRDQRPIRVPSGFTSFGVGLLSFRLLDSMILQGLFQSVGVDRPGPQDEVRTFELAVPPAGSTNEPSLTLLPGTPVVVIDFFGDDIAKKWAPRIRASLDRAVNSLPPGTTPAEAEKFRNDRIKAGSHWNWLVGEKGGAHSGQETCVMRDWFADVYRTRFNDSKGRPIYRLIDPARGEEKPGTVLGNTRQGTGVNAPDRVPEPRYGDSNVGEPANRQMIIADHLP